MAEEKGPENQVIKFEGKCEKIIKEMTKKGLVTTISNPYFLDIPTDKFEQIINNSRRIQKAPFPYID